MLVSKDLKQCPQCRDWYGKAVSSKGVNWEVHCSCNGYPCKVCGLKAHAATHNFYDCYTDEVWHVSVYSYLAGIICWRCRSGHSGPR